MRFACGVSRMNRRGISCAPRRVACKSKLGTPLHTFVRAECRRVPVASDIDTVPPAMTRAPLLPPDLPAVGPTIRSSSHISPTSTAQDDHKPHVVTAMKASLRMSRKKWPVVYCQCSNQAHCSSRHIAIYHPGYEAARVSPIRRGVCTEHPPSNSWMLHTPHVCLTQQRSSEALACRRVRRLTVAGAPRHL